jgi:plastocyanin
LINDPNLYWSLDLDHHAVTLSAVAPYDTIRFTATPRTMTGEAIADLPAPTFTSLDLDRASVSVDGLVRVLKIGSKIPVVATLAVGNLRHSDTVYINATDLATPPSLATFSIHPTPPDSAKSAVAKMMVARAMTADSTPISGLSVYYEVSDRTIATIDRASGLLQPLRPGHLSVIATATAYGVTKTDTLPFTIGYPVALQLGVMAQKNASGQIVNGFSPARLELGPGGSVIFFNQTVVPTDITFDDPTNVAQNDAYCGTLPSFCGGGNIDAWARDPDDQSGLTAIRIRRFPVPGTYTFHSTIFGTTGTIIVVDESIAIP